MEEEQTNRLCLNRLSPRDRMCLKGHTNFTATSGVIDERDVCWRSIGYSTSHLAIGWHIPRVVLVL
jgi:hypothetical protein